MPRQADANTHRMIFRLPIDIKKALAQRAREEGESQNTIGRRALKSYLFGYVRKPARSDD